MKQAKKIIIPLVVISLSLVIVFASCSKIKTPTEDATYLTPIPDETLAEFKEGTPITSKLQAVIAARAYLETTRLHSTTEPKVITVVEEQSKVWKIIFEGDWLVIPPDPDHTFTPPPPEHGCVYMTIDASDLVVSKLGTIECSP
jgi:hypothetical protein